MSNRTIAKKLDCHRSSVQRARKLLVHRQLIITARTNPHTWIMWSRYHPGVKQCQVLLYPIKQKMDNPWYEIPPSWVGVAKSQKRGSKLLPKLDVDISTRISTGEGVAPPGTALSPGKASAAAADAISHQGGKPPLPPAVQGERWTRKEYEFLQVSSERIRNLMHRGFTYDQAGERILDEEKEKLTSKERSDLYATMQSNVGYDCIFDMILMKRVFDDWNRLHRPIETQNSYQG
jgi:hypothetical protein